MVLCTGAVLVYDKHYYSYLGLTDIAGQLYVTIMQLCDVGSYIIHRTQDLVKANKKDKNISYYKLGIDYNEIAKYKKTALILDKVSLDSLVGLMDLPVIQVELSIKQDGTGYSYLIGGVDTSST